MGGLLGEFGIEAHCADDRGWGHLTNGALVGAAQQAGFNCILTRDRLFSESAARALKLYPEFAVVLVTLPQLRSAEFLEQFRRAWLRRPIQPVAGRGWKSAKASHHRTGPSGLVVWSVKAMAGETTTLHIAARVACRLEARLLRRFADN